MGWIAVMTVVASVFTIQAQLSDTTNPTSVDPKLIEWQNSRIPKEYVIAAVNIVGINCLDTSIVYSIANLHAGD
ncbi:MAG: hypothetical protein IPJ29_00010 [Chitinophagaceae bacterium]|nr:hypothetical protein [Chitinophagaceae bacterium]